MGELVHLAKIRVVQKKRPLREAYIEGFKEPLRFGVHDGYAAFYQVQPAEPLPATMDHLLAALAG